MVSPSQVRSIIKEVDSSLLSKADSIHSIVKFGKGASRIPFLGGFVDMGSEYALSQILQKMFIPAFIADRLAARLWAVI